MFLVYVDESGTSHPKDPEDYILSALISHESEWHDLNQKVQNLKYKYFPNTSPEQIEFHTKEVVRGKKEFSRLKISKRLDIMKDLADIINKSKLTIISVVVNKKKIYPHLKKKNWIEGKAWTYLWERIEKYLQNNQPRVGVDYGLITMDSIGPKPDEILRKKLVNLRKNGSLNIVTGHKILGKYIIEDPYFVSSSNVNLVQLADFTAWLVRRNHRKGNPSINEKLYKSLYQTITNKFDRDKLGSYIDFGLKFLP